MISCMKLRSSFEKVVVASLFSGALLFLSGCGIAGPHTGVPSLRAAFGPRCPSCLLTKDTGCRCFPDGWSCGQTAWRPLMPQYTEWIETTDATVEQIDMGQHDAEPRLAPTDGASTRRRPMFRRPIGVSLLPKWGAPWLRSKPITPLTTPSEMEFPTPERVDRIASAGI